MSSYADNTIIDLLQQIKSGGGGGGLPSDPLTGTHGGTGVNNGSNTLTLGGNVNITGAFSGLPASSGANSDITSLSGITASIGTPFDVSTGSLGSQAGHAIFFATFFQNAGSAKLYLAASHDGLSWWPVTTSFVYNPAQLRDPSFLQYNGHFWVAYTLGTGTTTSFAIVQTDDFITFGTPITVDMSSVASARTWAPEFYQDTDGSVYIFVAASNQSDGTGHSIYRIKANNTSLNSWTSPVAVVSTSSGFSVIDPFVVKNGSTYYLFFKNNQATPHIGYATASSITGTWTVIQDGSTDWMGIGTGPWEGPSIVQVNSTKWRMYLDKYNDQGIYYTESSDNFATWSAAARITTPANISYSHGTVVRSYSLDLARTVINRWFSDQASAPTLFGQVSISTTIQQYSSQAAALIFNNNGSANAPFLRTDGTNSGQDFYINRNGGNDYARFFGGTQNVEWKGDSTVDGNIIASTAGKTLHLKSGSNAKTGTVTLSSGAATVNTTAYSTTTSMVFFAMKTSSGTVGLHPYVDTGTNNTSFHVTGAATDNSTYYWAIIEQD